MRGSGTLPQRSPDIAHLDWSRLEQDLNTRGHAVLESLLSPEECRGLAGLYREGSIFRSKVVMARHGFGRGEYQYFAYPLPKLIQELRTALYRCLAPIANRWNSHLGVDVGYPPA